MNGYCRLCVVLIDFKNWKKINANKYIYCRKYKLPQLGSPADCFHLLI